MKEKMTKFMSKDTTLYESVKRNLLVLSNGADGYQAFLFGQLPVSLCDISGKFREYRDYKRDISSKWDPKKCNPIIVRDNPSKFSFEVADGGKRVLAALENGVGFIPALISSSDEPLFSAQWFIEQDDGKDPVTAVEKHNTKVALGDTVAIRINELFDEYGVRLSKNAPVKEGCEDIVAIWSKYADAYRIMSNEKLGEPCLRWILDILIKSGTTKDPQGLAGSYVGSLSKLYYNAPADRRMEIGSVMLDYFASRCISVIRTEAATCYPYVDSRTRLFYLYSDVIKEKTGLEITGATYKSKAPRISGVGNTYESSVMEYLAQYPDADTFEVANALKISLDTAGKHIRAIRKTHPEIYALTVGHKVAPKKECPVKPVAFKKLDGMSAEELAMPDSQIYLMTGISTDVIKKWRRTRQEEKAEKERKEAEDARRKAEIEKADEAMRLRIKKEGMFLLNHETFLTSDFMKACDIKAASSANYRLEAVCQKEAQTCRNAPITWRSPFFGTADNEDTVAVFLFVGGAFSVSVNEVANKLTGITKDRISDILLSAGYATEDGEHYSKDGKGYCGVTVYSEEAEEMRACIGNKITLTDSDLKKMKALYRADKVYKFLHDEGFKYENHGCRGGAWAR